MPLFLFDLFHLIVFLLACLAGAIAVVLVLRALTAHDNAPASTSGVCPTCRRAIVPTAARCGYCHTLIPERR